MMCEAISAKYKCYHFSCAAAAFHVPRRVQPASTTATIAPAGITAGTVLPVYPADTTAGAVLPEYLDGAAIAVVCPMGTSTQCALTGVVSSHNTNQPRLTI